MRPGAASARRLAPALLLALASFASRPAGTATAGDDPVPAPAPPPAPGPAPGGSSAGPGGALDGVAARRLARVMGALLTKYLEDKKDPARAAVWEEFLRGLAEDLRSLPESGDTAGTAALVTRVMARIGTAMGDPAKREVMAGILGVIAKEAMTELAGPRGLEPGRPRLVLPVRPPRPPRPPRTPRLLRALSQAGDPGIAAGAHLHLVQRPASPGALALDVQEVDAGSRAAEVGLKVGDTIVSVRGVPVTEEAPALLNRALLGRGELSVRVVRQGMEFEMKFGPGAPAAK